MLVAHSVTLASTIWHRATRCDAPPAMLLVRLAVGLVFLSEGIQKFLFSDALGVGRFAKIGIPAPELLAPFVGVVEILCGTLVLVGLATRLAAVPLAVVMLVAIATTKIPMLIDKGFWTMAHESRTDFAMLLCACCLVWIGAGPISLDGWLTRRRTA
jgi:putative oxidoreductase